MAAAVTISAADLSECVELHSMRNLYLKPIAKLVIVVTMPALKIPGKEGTFSYIFVTSLLCILNFPIHSYAFNSLIKKLFLELIYLFLEFWWIFLYIARTGYFRSKWRHYFLVVSMNATNPILNFVIAWYCIQLDT